MLHLATFGCTLRIDCKVGNMSFNRTVLMDFCVSAHCWDWTCESPTTMWTVSLTLEMMLLVSIVHSLAVIMLNWAVCHSLVSLSCGEASVCDWVVLPNGMVKEHAVNCFLLGMRFACPHMSTLSFKVQMKFTQPQRSTWINHNDEVTCCCSNVLESQSPNCFVVLHCFAILLGGGLPTIPCHLVGFTTSFQPVLLMPSMHPGNNFNKSRKFLPRWECLKLVPVRDKNPQLLAFGSTIGTCLATAVALGKDHRLYDRHRCY